MISPYRTKNRLNLFDFGVLFVILVSNSAVILYPLNLAEGMTVMTGKTFSAKRITAVILLIAALMSCIPIAFAAESMTYMAPGKSKKVDIYVRVFVPSKKSPKNSVGHYDLMIKGTLRFHGKTFKNPVFSYRSNSTLDVFSAKNTKKVYEHSSRSDYFYGCHMYTYHTSVNGLSSVYKFINSVSDSVKSVSSHPRSGKAFRCELKGTFSDYKLKYVNCFFAVAKWMEIFGNKKFIKYYNNFYKGHHSSYLPKHFVKKFHGKLKKKY